MRVFQSVGEISPKEPTTIVDALSGDSLLLNESAYDLTGLIIICTTFLF